MAENNNPIPNLDLGQANQMLANILDACDLDQNEVPLEVLTTYKNYRRERYTLQKIVIILVLLIFLVLPVFFISPKFTITDVSEEGASYPVYEINVSTQLPIRQVSATVNGYRIAVAELESHRYSVQPPINGKLEIRVETKNRQYSTQSIDVTVIDQESPTLLSSQRIGDQVFIHVEDTGSGVDYEAVVAFDYNGGEYYPAEYDEEEGLIVFDFPTESVNVFIPDKNGNTRQLILTVNK